MYNKKNKGNSFVNPIVCILNNFHKIAGKKLPNSKILKKDVFKKKSKKGTAVRKFLFWKTNKDENLEYPAYLCYYLDYSEGRKDPIKKRLYPFNEEKIGLNFFKKILEDNIKKGWEKA